MAAPGAKPIPGPTLETVINLIMKGQEETSRRAKEAEKSLEKLTKAAKLTESQFKKLSLGMVTFIKTIVTSFIPKTVAMVKPLLLFNAASIKGAGAVEDLRRSLESLPSSERFVSMAEAAGMLGRIAVKSFTSMYAIVPKYSKQLVDVQKNMAKTWGPDGLKDVEMFFAAFEKDIPATELLFKAIQNKDRKTIEMLTERKNADIGIMSKILMAGGMTAVSPDLKGIVAYNQAHAKVVAALDDMWRRFITDNAGMLEGWANRVSGWISNIFDYIKNNRSSVQDLFDTFSKAAKTAASMLESMFGWFVKLSPFWQDLIIKGAALHLILKNIAGIGLGRLAISAVALLAPLGAVVGTIVAIAAGLAAIYAYARTAPAAGEFDTAKMKEYFKKQKEDVAAKEVGKVNEIVEGRKRELAEIMESVSRTQEYLGIESERLQTAQEIAQLTGDTSEMERRMSEYASRTGKVMDDIVDARKKIEEQLRTATDEKEIKNLTLQLSRNELEIAKATLNVIQVQKKNLEASLLPIKLKLDLTKQDMKISQLNMQIAESIYGSAAFGIAAAVEYAQSLEAQKQLQMDSLKIIREQIANTDDSIAGQKIKQELLMKEKETQADIKQTQLEQLQTLKKIRDGYIDAVQAQTFGVGAFSKLLISREENIGMAMDMGAARRNYLLGQVQGPGARQVQSYKFGAYGGFTGSKGVFGGADLAERQATITGRLSPEQRMVYDLSKGTSRAVVAGAYNVGAQSFAQLQSMAGMGTSTQSALSKMGTGSRTIGGGGRSSVSTRSGGDFGSALQQLVDAAVNVRNTYSGSQRGEVKEGVTTSESSFASGG